jgi:hypothetical protein
LSTTNTRVTKYAVITPAEVVLVGVHEMITRHLAHDDASTWQTIYLLDGDGDATEVAVEANTNPDDEITGPDDLGPIEFEVFPTADSIDLIEYVLYYAGDREQVRADDVHVTGFPVGVAA